MAKKSKIAKNQQRERLAAKYAERRKGLRARSVDPSLELEERMEARAALAMLPRNSAENRLRNRCLITGRPRGYYRRLGISRVMVRDLAHAGVLPGMTKSSW
ncbi:MAG: 30S ribosomal protein S14 [Planctomycetota bacterium]